MQPSCHLARPLLAARGSVVLRRRAARVAVVVLVLFVLGVLRRVLALFFERAVHGVLRLLREPALQLLEDDLVLVARGVSNVLRQRALVFGRGLLERVDGIAEARHRLGVFLGRRRRLVVAGGDLRELAEPLIRDLGQHAHPLDIVERERDTDLLDRALEAEGGIARDATGRGRSGASDEHRRGETDGERRPQPRSPCGVAALRCQREGGFAHQARAQLATELVAEMWLGKSALTQPSASREGMSWRSAPSARNWIPRTVPSRLPIS